MLTRVLNLFGFNSVFVVLFKSPVLCSLFYILFILTCGSIYLCSLFYILFILTCGSIYLCSLFYLLFILMWSNTEYLNLFCLTQYNIELILFCIVVLKQSNNNCFISFNMLFLFNNLTEYLIPAPV